MSLHVLCIVGSVNEQNSIVKHICAHDWTAELAIIVSNDLCYYFPEDIIEIMGDFFLYDKLSLNEF